MSLDLIKFLRPDTRKLLLFGLFSFICVGGVIQSYAFIDDAPGVEKPPFYDWLKGFALWSSWLMFTAPLHFLMALICRPFDLCTRILQWFPGLGGVRFPLGSIVYSYIAASWLVHSWDNWVGWLDKRRRWLILLVPLVLISILSAPSMVLISRGQVLYPLSIFGIGYMILTFYIISAYGLFKELSSVYKMFS